MSLFSVVKEKMEFQKVLLATSPWVSDEMIQNYQQLQQDVTQLSPDTRKISKVGVKPIRSPPKTKPTPTRKKKKASPKRKK